MRKVYISILLLLLVGSIVALSACGGEDFSGCVSSKKMITISRAGEFTRVGSIETDQGSLIVELSAYGEAEIGQYCTFTQNMLTGFFANVYCEEDERCE